jgi:hypothetical protein
MFDITDFPWFSKEVCGESNPYEPDLHIGLGIIGDRHFLIFLEISSLSRQEQFHLERLSHQNLLHIFDYGSPPSDFYLISNVESIIRAMSLIKVFNY